MNQILMIKQDDLNFITKYCKLKNIYLAQIDGKNIQTLIEYMEAIKQAFIFPEGMFTNTDNFDAYNDWMRDFTWLDEYNEYNGYALVIHHFNQLLSHDLATKEIILEIFKDTILPFWEEEVLRTVVEGEVKSFDVYLIE